MQARIYLSLFFILICFALSAQKDDNTNKDNKPKNKMERPKDEERPNRPNGQRPGGGRGQFTVEQWKQFSESMPKIGKVSGTIIDESTGKPMEYVTIALLLGIDSSIVDGTITDAKGQFIMEELPIGRFFVSAEFMGYETYNSERFMLNPRRSPEVDLGTIPMNFGARNLEEVVVEEKRAFMELELDKKIFNVSDNITVVGGTATEVLEQIPSVEVDMDGNVSLRGSQNFTILIDGRPTAMAGGDPAAVLELIPAETIDRVEVITNPSAKYDPDGMAGILNIILKKNKKIGLNGLVNVSYTIVDEYSLGGTLGYRNKKINIYGSYNHRNNEREFTRENYRQNFSQDTTFSFEQKGEGTRRRVSNNLKFGLDFFPNSSSTIYTTASYGFQKGKDASTNIYQYFDANDNPTFIGRVLEAEEEPETNKEFTLGYQKRFKNNWSHTLNLDLNYSDNFEEETSDIENGFFSLDDVGFFDPIDSITTQNDLTDSDRRVIQARMDYEKPFENKAKMEIGYKSIVRFTNTLFDSSNDILDNEFQFDEQIHAVYGTYAYPVTEKFSIKGGLRLEHAVTDSELFNTGQTFDKNYFSWFPSLTFSQNMGDKGQMSLGYSRRINRPRTRQINPFVSFSDPLNFRQGNPDLNPEYTNAVELTYMKRWDKLTFTPSLYYRYTTDIINRYKTVDDEGVSTLTYVNLSHSHAYGLEINIMYNPTKWWRLMPSIDLTQTILDPSNVDADLNTNNFRVGGRIMSNMTVWKNLDIQLFAFYRLPSKIAQGNMKGMIFTSIGAKKKILKDKGSIGINIRDPFGIGKFRFTTEGDTFYQDGTRQREPYVTTFSFSYRFGKQERNRKGRGDRDRGSGMGSGMDDMMD